MIERKKRSFGYYIPLKVKNILQIFPAQNENSIRILRLNKINSTPTKQVCRWHNYGITTIILRSHLIKTTSTVFVKL